MSALWSLAAAVVLLVVNAFFVALEFSLVGSRHTLLEPQVAEGDRRASRALEAIGNLDLQLAGAQLGITMASLGLGIVAEPAIAHFVQPVIHLGPVSAAAAHTVAVVVALLMVTFLHLVIGEMVPKNIALADPERTLLRVVGPNRWYLKVFKPVLRVLSAMGNAMTRIVGVQPRRALATTHTAEELAAMFAVSHDEGLIEDFAADLLTGVLDFGGRNVASVMVPRSQVSVITRETTAAEAEAVVIQRGHSRLPVVGEDLDDVRGFIHAKDLLALDPGRSDQPVPLRLVRQMLLAGVDQSLEDLLLRMRRSRVHFALVLDGDGHTAGIVTLEDLLEELVGDILDESDRPERPEP